jgi:hypothetical protein
MGNLLKTGDTVKWKGCWGKDDVKLAKITEISLCVYENVKYGDIVSEVSWDKVIGGRKVIVDLDNGHWAWGFQISPI